MNLYHSKDGYCAATFQQLAITKRPPEQNQVGVLVSLQTTRETDYAEWHNPCSLQIQSATGSPQEAGKYKRCRCLFKAAFCSFGQSKVGMWGGQGGSVCVYLCACVFIHIQASICAYMSACVCSGVDVSESPCTGELPK